MNRLKVGSINHIFLGERGVLPLVALHHICGVLTCGLAYLPVDGSESEKEHKECCADEVPMCEWNMMGIALHVEVKSIDGKWSTDGDGNSKC